MGLDRFVRISSASKKEPDFIRTSKWNGRKSVDFDKFFADPLVKKRMDQLSKRLAETRSKHTTDR